MYPISQTANYDRAATMFSPDGRLYQVEYASKIVNQGTIGVALKYDKGVLFAADKRVPSKLVLSESIEKMFVLDTHIAALSAGLVGDARRLVDAGRGKAQENKMYYEEPIQVETLSKEIASIKQVFTQYGGMRPFGISLIIGGVDNTGKRLFETEPSGALAEYAAVAIGKGKNKAMEVLEKEYKESINFEDGMKLLVKAMKATLDEKEKLEADRLEFGYIDDSRQFSRVSLQKIKDVLGK